MARIPRDPRRPDRVGFDWALDLGRWPRKLGFICGECTRQRSRFPDELVGGQPLSSYGPGGIVYAEILGLQQLPDTLTYEYRVQCHGEEYSIRIDWNDLAGQPGLPRVMEARYIKLLRHLRRGFPDEEK